VRLTVKDAGTPAVTLGSGVTASRVVESMEPYVKEFTMGMMGASSPKPPVL
jgi:hypothetical protein